jgi:hypothetical protein
MATLSKLLSDAAHSKTNALRVRKDNPAAGVAKPDRGSKRESSGCSLASSPT